MPFFIDTARIPRLSIICPDRDGHPQENDNILFGCRYNGFLGAYSTNNRGVEVQMMRRFCRDSFILEKYEKLASATDNTFGNYINEICQGVKSRGTFNDIENVTLFDMVHVSSRSFQFDNVDIWLNHSNLKLPGKKFEYFLTEREHECVSQMYTFIFGQNIIVPNSC